MSYKQINGLSANMSNTEIIIVKKIIITIDFNLMEEYINKTGFSQPPVRLCIQILVWPDIYFEEYFSNYTF